MKKKIDISKIMKRKNQLRISTWHGTPLKKIGRDVLGENKTKFIQVSNFTIAGCDFTAQILKNAFCDDFPVLLTGTPRNDILCNQNYNMDGLKNRLNIPVSKKIILFAPTFRDEFQDNILILKSLSPLKIIEAVTKKFGSSWCIVFRVHHSVKKYLDFNLKDYYKKNYIIDGNIGFDMAEYLKVTDILITDFSGSMFDFLLTKRPCFIYAPDARNYIFRERGLYLSFEKLPFPYSENISELLMSINNFDNKKFQIDATSFLKQIGNIEDGNASERIVEIITTFKKTKTSYLPYVCLQK